MKNRNLLIGLLVLFLGSGMFVLTTSATFRQVVNHPDNGPTTDGVTDGIKLLSAMRSNQATGKIEAADVMKARMQYSGLKSSAALGLNWQSMGPDNYAGRTRGLVLDNRVSDRSTIFAGSVSGGIWKSTTSGLTWTQVPTGDILLNVSCMAQAPNGDIYAGSGESFSSGRFNLYDGFIGHGIYKSTDGNSFSKLASTDPGSFNNSDSEWAYVNKIAAGDNNKVFAATNGGLKYSADGGSSWTMAKAGSDNLSGVATDVAMASDGAVAATVGNLLYVSANGDPNNFVLRSTGAGQDSLPSAGLSRIISAFAPSDPSTIYAVLIADGNVTPFLLGQLQGIYVSKDKGITWSVVGPGGSTLFNVFGNTANTIHRGDYAACIVVNPTDPDVVYLGGVNVWEGRKVLETGFYQWQQKTVGEAGSYFHAIVPNTNNPSVFYFASDRGLAASQDGLTTFKDLNRNYKTSMFYTVAFDDKGNALGGAQGEGIVYLDKTGNTVETGNKILTSFIGGTVEMSMISPESVFYSSNAGFMTRSADLGVSEANDFVPSTISNVNATVFLTPFTLWESFNNVNSRDSVNFVAKTKSYAAGEEIIIKSKTAYNTSKKFPFKYTLTADLPKGDSIRVKDVISSRFFLGVTNAVYMSKAVLDFSAEPKFFKVATIEGIPSCMAYSSDANYLFVGTTDGKLIRIANLALAYDSLRADVSSAECIVSNSVVMDFTGRYVTSVSVDPDNDQHVLVTLGNYGNDTYVYHSVNALARTPAFTSVQGNLPAMPVYASLIEMTNTNRVILGTDLGIFTTESLGSNTNWTAENNGMGALPVMMIRQQTKARPFIEDIGGVSNLGAIYIATHGKGIYENRLYVGINDPDKPFADSKNQITVFPNPVRNEVNFSLSPETPVKVSAVIYDLAGRKIKEMSFGRIDAGEQQLSIPFAGMNKGSYVLQLMVGSEVKTAKFIVAQ